MAKPSRLSRKLLKTVSREHLISHCPSKLRLVAQHYGMAKFFNCLTQQQALSILAALSL